MKKLITDIDANGNRIHKAVLTDCEFDPPTSLNGIAVVNQTDESVSINPNVLNRWGEVSSLSIQLLDPTDNTIVNEYMIEFISGSTATNLILPSNLTYIDGVLPTIEPNATYQISIVNNLCIVAKFS